MIRRNDVVRAYDLGLARRGRDAPEIPAGIRRTGQVDFIEVDLTGASHCVGRSVADISSELPKDSLLVSIRRADGSVVFPRGDTVLQAGDRIVAYAREGPPGGAPAQSSERPEGESKLASRNSPVP